MATLDLLPGLETSPYRANGHLELGLAGEGWLRYAVTDLTSVLEEARERLDLSPVAAAALGRSQAAAVLLLRLALKTPSRLVLEVRGDGPLGTVVVETDDAGALRGMVGNPRVDLPSRPDGKLPVAEAVGQGKLTVIREGTQIGVRPYSSQVQLVSGEIGLDVAHFLEQSEQTPSAVMLGVLARPAGIAAAGGMIVEVLPGAPEAVVARLEANLASLPGISQLLAEGGLPRVVETVLTGLTFEVVERREVNHRCRCSRERLRDHLAAFGAEDRAGLETTPGATAVECVFCGTVYTFTASDW